MDIDTAAGVMRNDFAMSNTMSNNEALTPMQENADVGDTFMTVVTESMVDRGVTVGVIEMAYPSTCEDWLERVARGFVYAVLTNSLNKRPFFGWVHRSSIVKIPQEVYNEIQTRISDHDNTEGFEDFESIARPYFDAHHADQAQNGGMEPYKCPECNSDDVLIRKRTLSTGRLYWGATDNGLKLIIGPGSGTGFQERIIISCSRCGHSEEPDRSLFRDDI